jgi:putative sterol carrier protein/putative NADPH-quinone reductase
MQKETIGALYKSTEISEKALLLEILESFNAGFNKQKAKDFTGSFQFIITCDGTDVLFTIQVSDSDFRIIHDLVDINPLLEVKCDFEMFCNITLGNFNPVTAILSGKIKLNKGIFSLSDFAKFGSLFSYREIDLKLPASIKHPKVWTKPQRILLVNGSPRKEGSTKLMLEWFKEGLPADQTTSIDVIDISTLKIGKCLHCFKCWTDHPNVCVNDDDANFFIQKMNEADLIAFFIPLSVFTMPSEMKAALERMFSQTTPFFYNNDKLNGTGHPVQQDRKSQAFLQFLVWGFPEMKYGNVLEANLNIWAAHSWKQNLGCIKRPGVNMMLGDPRMQFVRKKVKAAIADVASSVYHTGIIPKDKKAIIEKVDYISTKDFRFYATHYWISHFKTSFWDNMFG